MELDGGGAGVSAQLAAGEDVIVVAERLTNGAPHPMFGHLGVVIEVRAGRFPVRVLVDGRPIMFAVDELARHADGAPAEISDGETAVRDVR